MIESVGYTQDGLVWIRILMDIRGEKMTGVLTLKPDVVGSLADSLKKAAEGAKVYYERNSTDFN